MVVDGVDGEADDLDAPAIELRLDLGHVTKLGRAHGGEVPRVREQHGPRVTDSVVEADSPFRGVRLEVRCRVADLQSHVLLLVKIRLLVEVSVFSRGNSHKAVGSGQARIGRKGQKLDELGAQRHLREEVLRISGRID